MRNYILRLYNDDDLIDLELHQADLKPPLSAALVMPKKKVISRSPYRGQLMGGKTRDIRHLDLMLNHYPVSHQIFVEHGTIDFTDPEHGDRLFLDAFGLSRFQLNIRLANGEVMHLESEYFQIMVESGMETLMAERIGDYTARHNRILIYGTNRDYLSAPFMINAAPSMEDKLRLLETIAARLEYMRYAVEQNPHRSTRNPADGSLKAWMDFYLHNPGALSRSTTGAGIPIQGKRYVPAQKPEFSSALSTDVYENQCILAFLRQICLEIDEMIPQVEQTIRQLPDKAYFIDEFVTSSSFLYQSARAVLGSMQEDLNVLRGRFFQLYRAYEKIIPASEIVLKSPPVPTAAFTTLPAYRPVFQTMSEWFPLSQVKASDMCFMQMFLEITTLYEVYVLTKLAAYFEREGFEKKAMRALNHPDTGEFSIKNLGINNYFEFVKGPIKASLYYQPVILSPQQLGGLLDLERAASLSWYRGGRIPTHGKHYTPDYVLKVEHADHPGARYIILDAKFTDLQTAVDFKVIPLVWKYLNSLRCKKPEDSITGLYIFHGKSRRENPKELVHSIFDMMADPHSHFPQVEVITLFESDISREEQQMQALEKLLKVQMDFDQK